MDTGIVNSKITRNKHIGLMRVARKIKINDPYGIPKIILLIGPCRNGTTALLKLFSASGIKSYNQPIKGILRWFLDGAEDNEVEDWTLPSESIICLKETLGPYGDEESAFDPVESLRIALTISISNRTQDKTKIDETVSNILREKVHIVFVGRNPYEAWVSWKEKFLHLSNTQDLLQSFITAYSQTHRLLLKYRDMGIKYVNYVLEANKEPEKSSSSLFLKLGLENKPKIDNWLSLPTYQLSNQPETYKGEMKHHTVTKSERLEYKNKNMTHIPIEEASVIGNEKLENTYFIWKDMCENDLKILF